MSIYARQILMRGRRRGNQVNVAKMRKGGRVV